MSKKKKILVILVSAVLMLIAIVMSIQFALKSNSEKIDDFLIRWEESAQAKKEEKVRKTEGEEKTNKIRKAREMQKTSKLRTQPIREEVPENIRDSKCYRKAWDSIDSLNRIILGLRIYDKDTYDDPSSDNFDFLEGTFFLTSMFSPSTFNNLLSLDADSVYYAVMEAMYDPDIRWETKYFITQITGEREERRLLPIFREIVADVNEARFLRVTAIDQISSMKDRDSIDIALTLLDDELPVMRDKASSALSSMAEPEDKFIYDQVLSHFYQESDPVVKASHLGAIIFIGKERSLLDVEKILETATNDEKQSAIVNLSGVHTKESFEILKRLYDPQNEDMTILVTSSMAKLSIDDANQFLCDVVSQANGMISVMAADDLVEHNQVIAIPYLEEALQKEQNPEFINNYKEMLIKLMGMK